jgi:hypothetical protein
LVTLSKRTAASDIGAPHVLMTRTH